jgi:hypothetical protein
MQELAIAKSQLRSVQLVNKLQDLNTKYQGLRPQHSSAGISAGSSGGAYHPFRLQWETTDGANVEQRRKVVEHFVQYQSLAAKEFANVRVMLAFHLVPGGADVCKLMLEGNFAVFSVLDGGFYGQGIYVTTDIDYAVTAYGRGADGRIYDELHVVFCFVVIGNSW